MRLYLRRLVVFGLLLLLVLVPACSGGNVSGGEPTSAAPSGQQPPASQPAPAVSAPDNLIIFTTVEDFSQGTHEGTEPVPVNNGAVALKSGMTKGTYTSPEIATKPFEYLILSWNADTPKGTYIEIEGRVHAGTEGNRKWSNWLSWGYWSASAFTGPDGKTMLPGSAPAAKAEDAVAKVDIDELYVRGSAGETADRFQFRVTLHGAEGSAPKVYLVAGTIRNSLKGQAIAKAVQPGDPDLAKLDKDLDVPAYSQYLRQTSISGSICSPTSVAMALGYFGVDVSPEEAAWGVNDYEGDMFGNWPFNTAYASAHGLTAYVEYGTPAEGMDPWYAVKREIYNGNPVIVSVRYRRPGVMTSSEPEVEGVPIDSTSGHLVLIRGFTWKDGREYVIVNDAAARKLEEVRRLYPADQFFRAWTKKVMYVIRRDEGEVAQACVQAPIEGTLVKVGSPDGGVQKYELQVDGNPVNINADNMRSIVVSYNDEKTTPVNPRMPVLSDSNLLHFKTDSKAGKYTYWFFGMNKETYKAEINWVK